ncbi:hypothetical protein [Pedobacter foliorum]|uniref:hypothetical protein n=1 Tax=Pedobacter foliorum TaxID=2739058 RepID=UPI001565FB7D|nr:hypothetical protein [Pedobacter foliorum]NRF37948.1 hypothetical protein [Pedobacter foliorum]
MKHNFSFNTHNQDFWPIYEAIKHIYPIGIKRISNAYFDYPGIKELGTKLGSAINEAETYKSWTQFTEEISKHYNLEVIGTTYGQAPSYSADIIIEQTETETFKTVKKLSFAISLVGNFFTIYGVDETFIIEKGDGAYPMHYPSINIVTASPFKEFESIFKELKETIETKFNDYKFIPYAVNLMVIDGLQVMYLDDKEEYTIYNALFNQFLDSYDSMFLRGDQYFGYTDWQTGNSDTLKIVTVVLSPPPPPF